MYMWVQNGKYMCTLLHSIRTMCENDERYMVNNYEGKGTEGGMWIHCWPKDEG